MEEDRHLDGRACVAVACGVVSLLLAFANPQTGIFFGAWAWILGGASVIAVEDPAGRRTRRLVLLVLYGFTAPPRD